MNTKQKQLLMNAFFRSQFSYCPLVWMTHSRGMNNKINRLHEKCLRLIYSDNTLSFQELLKRDGSVTIHQRNIQTLAIELYKVKNGLSPKIMNELFSLHSVNYNLRSEDVFLSRNVRTVRYGTESLSYLAPKIWSLIPSKIKEVNSLNSFKEGIKTWVSTACPCRLCKTYIQQVGFVDILDQ